MYTPSELERMPKQFERYMSDLERRVMEDAVARIKKNKEITSTADWIMLRINELKGFNESTRKHIQKALDLSEKEVNNLFQNALESGYTRDERLYKATGQKFIAFKDNKELQQAISSVSKQAIEDMKNITNTLGFAQKLNGKMLFTPMSEYFSGILDGAMIDITSGAFDYNKTITRVIAEMTNSGLRTVDYFTGWNNRVNVAARRAIMTGIGQITGKISEMNAQKLDTEYFEVSWHGTARPSHQEWQGKVYTMQELKDICGYGTVGGLCGANCRHSFYPFVSGVSERTYTDEQLAEMNAKENKPTKYQGKEYTSYEATQRMRQMETNMRAYRERIKLMEQAEVDEDTLLNTKCRYQAFSQQYTSFAKAMDLPQERQRVYGDRLGRVSNRTIKIPDINIHKSVGAAAKNYPVRLPDGTISRLQEGSKITKVFTFAGKGTKKEIRVAKQLERAYNISASEWKKVRGDGYVIVNNKSRHCELHWYETKETGRIDMKVKRYFDEG